MHDFGFDNATLQSTQPAIGGGDHHTETGFTLKVINFAAANKSWRLVCNSGNLVSCKAHCSRQFPGDALSIDECSKAVMEAFGGGLGGAACFPMNSVITRKSDGIVPLSKLRIGDQVLVPSESGIRFESVIGFLHWDENTRHAFVHLQFGSGSLTIHRDHLVPIMHQGKSTFTKACDVKVGDNLKSLWIDGSFSDCAVTEVSEVEETGLCCPLTTTGMIIVDSVVCSCYSSPTGLLPMNLSHNVCHLSMAPLRVQYATGLCNNAKDAKPKSGIHPYANALLTAVTGMVFSA